MAQTVVLHLTSLDWESIAQSTRSLLCCSSINYEHSWNMMNCKIIVINKKYKDFKKCTDQTYILKDLETFRKYLWLKMSETSETSRLNQSIVFFTKQNKGKRCNSLSGTSSIEINILVVEKHRLCNINLNNVF